MICQRNPWRPRYATAAGPTRCQAAGISPPARHHRRTSLVGSPSIQKAMVEATRVRKKSTILGKNTTSEAQGTTARSGQDVVGDGEDPPEGLHGENPRYQARCCLYTVRRPVAVRGRSCVIQSITWLGDLPLCSTYSTSPPIVILLCTNIKSLTFNHG